MAGGPLVGVRVVDLTDERAIYGAKLLADLGADVVRPEPPDGDQLRRRGPFTSDGTSLWHAFFATSRRMLRIDPQRPDDRRTLQQLIEKANVLLTCSAAFGRDLLDLDRARQANPELVVVDTSSFGDDGPWKDFLAPDLVAGALAGAVATTGAADGPPLKTFGELNFMVSGVYAAVAALSALRHSRESGEGQRVAVSVHECIASCLEHVFMLAWYGEKMNRSRVLARQAGLHWSSLYQVMTAKTGAIMVTPAPDIQAQLAWLIDEDAYGDLLDEKYEGPANAPLFGARMMQLLREWVGTKDAEALFFQAQERHAPYGWVLPVERLAENPQLAARHWWSETRLDGSTVRAPGIPYHFSNTPAVPNDSFDIDANALLGELGWVATR